MKTLSLFKTATQNNFEPDVKTNRIEEFSDGVFSIVITLLILNVTIPNIPHELVATQLPQSLMALGPQLFSYVLSFFIIGIYWLGHHNVFLNIERSDRTLIWLNNLFLMMVTFIPFPAKLIGQYGDQQISIIIYGLCMIACSLTLGLVWGYANWNNRLVNKEMDPCTKRLVMLRISIGPVLAVIAILCSFISVWLSIALYTLSAMLAFIPNRIFTNQHLLPGAFPCNIPD